MTEAIHAIGHRRLPTDHHQIPIGTAGGQRGMALVVALIILMVLTILGITAMSTSSLQEKMAGNVQEQSKAFQHAESGVNTLLNDTTVELDINTPAEKNYSYTYGTARVRVEFIQKSEVSTDASRPSAIEDMYGKGGFKKFHFQIKSRGASNTGAEAIGEQGVMRVIPTNE